MNERLERIGDSQNKAEPQGGNESLRAVAQSTRGESDLLTGRVIISLEPE